jgi:hypothetical protein
MEKNYLTCLFLLFSLSILAQTKERVISGQLKSNEDGSSLPGVNVLVKGTTIGTVTDAEGRYSLSVPIGSVLVFSFIGMKTREVLVTETSLQSVNGSMQIRAKPSQTKWNPSILQDSVSHPQDGVATLTDHSPTFKTPGTSLQADQITSIRKSISRKSIYVINTNADSYFPSGLKLQFNTSLGVETIGQLPTVQTSYAQGRNANGAFTWRGPDTNEIMNWGPPIKTLEYDGTIYSYDSNGQLVTAGSGNGNRAKSYNAFDFFKTGLSFNNEITAYFPGLAGSTSHLDWTNKSRSGVIPNNTSSMNTLSLTMKKIKISPQILADASVSYNESTGRLVNRGSNSASIMGALLSTSSTFNNQEGYRLATGAVRSSAPNYIDNPNGLTNEFPDKEEADRFHSSLGLKYDNHKKFQMNVGSGFENQNSKIINGIFLGLSGYPMGRRTERTENMKAISLSANSSYKHGYSSFSLGYQFKQESRNVNRQDGFKLVQGSSKDILNYDSLNQTSLSLDRVVHEALMKFNYDKRGIDFQVANRSYFSSTVNQSSFINIFPSASVKVRIIDYLPISGLSEMRWYASIARTIRESPLLFGNPAALSIPFSTHQYNKYFENREIAWNKNVNPETEIKFETGLNVYHYDGIEMNIEYYNNTTSGLLLPIWNASELTLKNSASVNNIGGNISLTYRHGQYYRDKNWGVSIKWAKYNSVVTSLDYPTDFISIGGFKEIQTAAAKGEVLGAIYGTTFLRDESGRKIIGTDGFPLVDTKLRKIGNPLPNYTISLNPYFVVHERFRAEFILDLKKGGEVWNGTKATLNYLGRSAESAEQRSTSNFVFDGVDANGTTNTIPVSFYDPAVSIGQNRWVRYGYSGVGEEQIEDASWIRLNELSLSYKFYKKIGSSKSEIGISVIGKNLLLITPYSGVDPASSLFGYSSGQGLDLFNTPSSRTFHLQLSIKI